jgi:cytochrome c551/c552
MRLVCFTLLALLSVTAAAALRSIELPTETATLRPSDLPGAIRAARSCVICHSADYISYQPPGMSLAQWTGEVAKMQHAYGAPVSDGDVKLIGAYLAVAYGSAKAGDADVVAAASASPSSASVSTNESTGSVDVNELLNSNGCLGCHAVNTRVVGPAYRDVAARYHGDPQAAMKLTKSILEGSSGHWGQVPMPPNAGVSEKQAKALVDFVLKQ